MRNEPGSLLMILALAVIATVVQLTLAACGGGDGEDRSDGSADADVDTDAAADAGGDGGAPDAGADGDGDADSDSESTICDPRICDDGCYAARKDQGECIDGFCVCSGDRGSNCNCVVAGAPPAVTLLDLVLGLVR